MAVHFDFDRWMYLAREEPKRFEELRRQIIEEQIMASSPSIRKRLRGLQFQIDARRRLSGSAMGACIEISNMMFEHLYNELLPAMHAFAGDDYKTLKTASVREATILDFPEDRYRRKGVCN